MDDDFLLLNGDTLFEDARAACACSIRCATRSPSPSTTSGSYDDDDMKVALDGAGRVLAIGKDLPAEAVGAEAIGLIAFAGSGPKLFVEGLERAVRRPDAVRRWYLSVVHELAEEHGVVGTASIRGLWWREIDGSDDLARARRGMAAAGWQPCDAQGSRSVGISTRLARTEASESSARGEEPKTGSSGPRDLAIHPANRVGGR